MKNMTVTMIAVTVLLWLSLPPCIEDSNDATGTVFQPSDIPETESPVVILTTIPTGNIASMSGDNMRTQGSFDGIAPVDIVILDGEWIIKNNISNTTIQDLIRGGNPILLVNGDASILSSVNPVHSSAFATSAKVYGLFFDSQSNATYCFSVMGEGMRQSIDLAFNWINESRLSMNSATLSSDSNTPILYSLTKVHGNFGELTVRTQYTKYSIDNNNCFILTEYNLTGKPYPENSFWDNWIAIADIKITTNHLNSQILSHGPTISSTSQITHSVNLSATSSNTTVSKNWYYTVREAETMVTKTSNFFSVWHDTDEFGSYKLETKVMKPGTISFSSKGNNIFSYQENEDYMVSFYKDRFILSNQFETEYCHMTVTII